MEETGLLKHLLSENANKLTVAWLDFGVKTLPPSVTDTEEAIWLNISGPVLQEMDLLLTSILPGEKPRQGSLGGCLFEVATHFAPGPAWEIRGWL